MVQILHIIFFLLLSSQLVATELALGVIHFEPSEEVKLSFYTEPDANLNPAIILSVLNDGEKRELSVDIKQFSPHIIMSPLTQVRDRVIYVFRCVSKREGWLKVVVNEKSLQTLWIEENELTQLIEWESFLLRITNVWPNDVDRNPLTREFRSKQPVFLNRENLCLSVKSVMGSWVELQHMLAGCPEKDDLIDSSLTLFIRWKEQGNLLVNFSM